MNRLIPAFIVWRVTLFLIAYISPLIIPAFGARFPYYKERLIDTGLPHFIWSFGNFDGVHYLGIAKDAYAYQFTQAFFPIYPVLIRIGSYLTFGNLLISALLISNIAFLAGLIIFHKLVSNFFDKKIAMWSCLFLLTFPTSFFFGSVYTEGLFFLLIIGSFYLFSKNKIILAAILGAVASGTKLMGLFLLPAFYFAKNRKSLYPLLLIPVGFLSYVAYLKIKFNNPLYFLSSQQIFGQERSTDTIVLLPQVFVRYIKILLTTNGLLFTSALLELVATVFGLTIILVSYKKIPKEWFVFALFTILIPTLTGTLISMPRYVIIAFPIYIALALIKSTLLKTSILIIFTVLLFIMTCLFTQGYWVA